MRAHMAAGMAARMAGNLQDAKEILEESVPKGYYKYARFAMVAEQNEKNSGPLWTGSRASEAILWQTLNQCYDK